LAASREPFPGRVALAAGGRIRIVGPEARIAGGTNLRPPSSAAHFGVSAWRVAHVASVLVGIMPDVESGRSGRTLAAAGLSALAAASAVAAGFSSVPSSFQLQMLGVSAVAAFLVVLLDVMPFKKLG
jgi:hypothetical protein